MKKAVTAILISTLLLSACGNNEAKEEPAKINKVNQKQNVVKEKEEQTQVVLSPTTGLPIESNRVHNAFAVMIENSSAARPHSGLTSADVVYEMEVESSITRFMAIYHDQLPELIGPARSARDYYIPISEDWNLPYIHFGGSPQAYELLNKMDLVSIDGITKGDYFSRDNSRVAPHNAYLHPEKLPKFNNSVKNEHYKLGSKSYSNEESISSIQFSYNNFTDIKYRYDNKSKKYLRNLNGEPHNDRETGKQIAVSNIIIQFAEHSNLDHDDKGRINIDLESGGKAFYFTNGKMIEGIWANEGKTNFYDSEGFKITLNPGNTWIQVVRPNENIIIN